MYEASSKEQSDRELAAQRRNRGNGWSTFCFVLGVLFTIGAFNALKELPVNRAERLGYLIGVLIIPSACFVAAWSLRR